jgi:predicted O-methyltransferase YrrM
MRSAFFMIWQYVRYRLRAYSAHGIHSPFVFSFVTEILQDKRTFYAFDVLDDYRSILLADKQALPIVDFGAGSHRQQEAYRRVNEIARTAGRNKKMGELLFRMVNYFQPRQILELGTSLGMGTAYLAAAQREARVISIEGSSAIAAYAQEMFNRFSFSQIQQVVGRFDDALPDVLRKESAFDFVFVDGNHQEEATIRYFNQLLPHLHENSVLIFDDIHWSRGMLSAWQYIQQAEAVTLSIDLFYFGIVFFKKDFIVKQHFELSYA